MEINCVVEHLNNLMREPPERDMNYLKIKFPKLFSHYFFIFLWDLNQFDNSVGELQFKRRFLFYLGHLPCGGCPGF